MISSISLAPSLLGLISTLWSCGAEETERARESKTEKLKMDFMLKELARRICCS